MGIGFEKERHLFFFRQNRILVLFYPFWFNNQKHNDLILPQRRFFRLRKYLSIFKFVHVELRFERDILILNCSQKIHVTIVFYCTTHSNNRQPAFKLTFCAPKKIGAQSQPRPNSFLNSPFNAVTHAVDVSLWFASFWLVNFRSFCLLAY